MTLSRLPSFADVFEALHGVSPYPWQRRLADSVVSTGQWPAFVGVPTGTGKTATLDIALYAMAAEAHLPPTERRMPRRVVMVVDRRTIVDQAFERAQHILARLQAADEGPLAALGARLLSLMERDAEQEAPLQLALLRGGVPRDDGWARRPDQALLAVSTVDQVGSRLLFRGYGVRPTMQSIHAGLLGNDVLLLLDEVHLARPFFETLSALAHRYRTWRDQPLPDRWQVVSLSATSGATTAFGLDDDDLGLPRLRTRLEASKPVACVPVPTSTHDRSGNPHRKWVKALVDHTRELLDEGARCVGVVVNRVDVARAVASQLGTAMLVTGRMRGVDRSIQGRHLADHAGPGWKDRAHEEPFVCVATQCIEAGADLDFDAMVTEVASLDALVQRFGRVNRTGHHAATPIRVVAPKDVDSEDPIYGLARGHAWAWLLAQEALDAGPLRLRQLGSSMPPEAMAPHKQAAVLLPAHLDLLAQTSPIPYPDPDPALYLHGLEPPRPEVQVIWRADVPDPDSDAKGRQTSVHLAAVPPTSVEALSLPLGAARRWLAGDDVASFADVGGTTDEPRSGARDWQRLVAFGWNGSQATPLRPAEIRPGQTIIVPSFRGGLHLDNFAPEDREPVHDHGDLARTIRTGRVHLRLDPRVHRTLQGLNSLPRPADGELQSLHQQQRTLRAWIDELDLTSLEVDDADRHLPRLLQLLKHDAYGVRSLTAVDQVWVVQGNRLPTSVVLALARGHEGAVDDALTADGASIASNRPVTLDEHLRGVEAWARSLATACGLPDQLVDDLARAGRWHDLGKADPGFQILLHGGDEIRAAGGPLLAKSGRRLADREARQRAWERARLPGGFRHEMVSVRLLTDTPAGHALLEEAHDPELVLHLVASHHGWARPFAPIEDHGRTGTRAAVEVTWDDRVLCAPGDHGLDAIDSGLAERFDALQRRYGWWGLAWLEAILRLADHRESEAEERSTP